MYSLKKEKSQRFFDFFIFMAIIGIENFIFCAIIMAGVDTQKIDFLKAQRTDLEKKIEDTWDQLKSKEKQLLVEKKRLNSAEEAQQKEISEFVNTLLGEIKNLGAIIADYEAQIAKTNQEIDDLKDSIKKLNEQAQSVEGVSISSTRISSAIDERSSDQIQVESQKETEPKQEVTQEVKTTPTSPQSEIASTQTENLSEDQKARQLRDLLNSLSADLETQNPQNGRVLLSLSQLQAIEKINQLRLSSLRQEDISDFSLVEGDLSRSDKRYLWRQQRKALNKDTKEAKKDKKQLKKLAEARARNLNEKNQVNYEAGRVAFMEMLNSSFFERGGYTDEHLAFAPKNTNLIIELCKNADKLRNP